MTCYVAGRFLERPRCRSVRAALVNRGYQVTSRWLYSRTATSLAIAQRECLEDIRQSDVLVLVEPRMLLPGGGGRYIEVGYALARKMPVLIWDEDAPCENTDGRAVFWTHELVSVYPTLDRLITALAAPAFLLSEGPIG